MKINERFEEFKSDLQDRLGARVGRKVEIIGEAAWFELGIVYTTAQLLDTPDEIAAEQMAEVLAKRFFIQNEEKEND
ncbi:hypothetical protein LCGC14_0998470 [marine sediment metagenome]|uniref:Uncharacterized protein n=1 Tax=marine sediment metagenome TaxID=412755 RepID=A0A0F9R9Y1_9ZZZZ